MVTIRIRVNLGMQTYLHQPIGCVVMHKKQRQLPGSLRHERQKHGAAILNHDYRRDIERPTERRVSRVLLSSELALPAGLLVQNRLSPVEMVFLLTCTGIVFGRIRALAIFFLIPPAVSSLKTKDSPQRRQTTTQTEHVPPEIGLPFLGPLDSRRP